MSRGIRHKLPVLAWLYLLVAEISSLKLKTKNQIEGIQLNDISTKIKKIKDLQLADAVALGFEDAKPLEKAIETVKKICNNAGSKIYKEKNPVYTLRKSQRQV